MRLLCPAKINLHLRVGLLRKDGFHPLLSWFCTVGLFDALSLELADQSANATAGDDSFVALTCDQPELPVDRKNLVVKVGDAWGAEARLRGSRIQPVRAHLEKRIPAGAGLGGGSSDGARMLQGLDALWKTDRSANELSEFAGRFGSDLPFFFFGPSSVCKGRGEIVQPTPHPAAAWAVLILPPIAMPTPDVYRKFDALGLGRDEDVEREPDWLAWSKLNARGLLTHLANDLEPPAFAVSPRLSQLRQDLEHTLARPVRMSGSGSSLFTLYDTRDEAELALRSITCENRFHELRIEAVALAPGVEDDLVTAGSTGIRSEAGAKQGAGIYSAEP